MSAYALAGELIPIHYRADALPEGYEDERHFLDHTGATRWRPSIHMPRWASRITLQVMDVWVGRIQEISEVDAVKEGWPGDAMARLTALKVSGNTISGQTAINWFACLWDSIYAKRSHSWESNPWVWVVELEVIQ